jgi:uncharacterized protein (DUF952 family)
LQQDGNSRKTAGMTEPVYKIMSEADFAAATREGYFRGSADDLRDGFIHLSAAHQLTGTLATHFAGQEGLVLLAVDAERLGDALRWEPSRNGMTFPHLYAPLDLGAVLWSAPLPLDADGRHSLPKALETAA